MPRNAGNAPGTSEPGPMVVVSNRLPVTAQRRRGRVTLARAPGGLVTALEAALDSRGRWVGWPGLPSEELAKVRGGEDLPSDDPGAGGPTWIPVPLSRREVAQYYGVFSNRVLWPVFHHVFSLGPVRAAGWRMYDRVNQRFAEVAAGAAAPDATIWVHDYQLLRVPHHLRRRRAEARIAFFLHIPFPAPDVFGTLPWARPLLRGLLGADYVGFHTATYAAHFVESVERFLGCATDPPRRAVQYEGRLIGVGVHPIGIDVAKVEQRARASLAEDPPEDDPVRMILGVDRLDYTKGIHERLLAIERLLTRYPEHRGRLVLIQVAVPSRERVPEYAALKRQVDEAVGRINGRFSERGWSPIRYLNRQLDPEELAGLCARSHVGLVTPLRDGMNLVAKEYVAAQVGEPGVLVLSEFAGAAEQLQEAVLVNPFDVEGMADALHTALAMPPEERRARMAALRDAVTVHDVHHWREGFLAAAQEAFARAHSVPPSPVEDLTRRLAPWLAQRKQTVLFLDYDGTLTPIVGHPDEARLDPSAEDALTRVAGATHLDVVVISGRSLADLRHRLPPLHLTLAGNHGLEIEGLGLQWQHPDLARWSRALAKAARRLDALGAAGAWVEDKGATLSWHVRRVVAERRDEVLRRGEAILASLGLRAARGKEVLEAHPPLAWHKGRAALHLLRQRHGEEWPTRVRALYLGDDRTDEDAYRSLQGIGRSVHVGPSESAAATFALPDPGAVLQLLHWLAAGGYLGLHR